MPEHQSYRGIVETNHHIGLRSDPPQPIPSVLKFQRGIIGAERPRARRAGRQSRPRQHFTLWRVDLRKVRLDFFPAQCAIIDTDLVHQPVKRVPSRDLRVNVAIGEHSFANATDQKINRMSWCFELSESSELSNLFAVDVE